ncbi:hypothetical protein D3C75_690400 [compost metagenome]
MSIGLQYGFLGLVYLTGIAGFVAVPAARRREAHAVFLFQNMLAWFLGLIAVEAGWLDYPVRELAQASSTSFVFEYLCYPVVAVYYNLYYPEGRSMAARLGWSALFAVCITIPEYIIEAHTDLVKYTGWKWYWTTISISLTLALSRLFFTWFFGPHRVPASGKR